MFVFGPPLVCLWVAKRAKRTPPRDTTTAMPRRDAATGRRDVQIEVKEVKADGTPSVDVGEGGSMQVAATPSVGEVLAAGIPRKSSRGQRPSKEGWWHL